MRNGKKLVLVSACLLGQNCKYSGGNNRNEAVLAYLRDKEVLPVCPEQLSGLPTPRPRVELRNGRAVNEFGEDVDALFRLGVQRALALLDDAAVDEAVLQSRSPTCGARQIYDGTFSGTLLPGQGLLAQALLERGIPVVDAAEIAEDGTKKEPLQTKEKTNEQSQR